MSHHDAAIVEKRAESLAKLSLTEHERVQMLIPSISPKGGEYDFLVRIDDGDEPPLPEFALEVKGISPRHGGSNLNGELNVLHSTAWGVGIPLCLFVFDVDRKTGYYAWVLEPVLGQGGGVGSSLQSWRQSERDVAEEIRAGRWDALSRLDYDAVSDILNKVVHWSRARSGRLLTG